jgi:hypothetical protein
MTEKPAINPAAIHRVDTNLMTEGEFSACGSCEPKRTELVDGVSPLEIVIWFFAGFLVAITISPDILTPIFEALK